LGYDVHSFAQGRELWLGGVQIPYEPGLAGHSDADVLLHAICDALLGAAALGDIGHHFSDKDERWRGVDSKLLLAECGRLVAAQGWKIGNVDATLVAEAPRIAPHVPRMRETIAHHLGIESGQVSIKATTNERMGFVGRNEGMAALATALLYRD
jgi:2-C-methyl-D-erythritol 2,4-cyclodiphosphate synthase